MVQHSRFGIRYEVALRWMPQNLTNKKPTLAQVMSIATNPGLILGLCLAHERRHYFAATSLIGYDDDNENNFIVMNYVVK